MVGASFLLTKADPWPTYRVLHVSLSLETPFGLLSVAQTIQNNRVHFQELQQYCPNVKFLRLGGESYVSEEIPAGSHVM